MSERYTIWLKVESLSAGPGKQVPRGADRSVQLAAGKDFARVVERAIHEVRILLAVHEADAVARMGTWEG